MTEVFLDVLRRRVATRGQARHARDVKEIAQEAFTAIQVP